MRGASGRRLGSERKRLVAAGTEVVLIQPTEEDHAVMGANLMSTRNRNPVIGTAIRTVREQLRAPEVAELLRDLPQGPGDKGIAGYKGHFYHFLEMDSGLRAGDCELSTVDTALLLCGALHAGLLRRRA